MATSDQLLVSHPPASNLITVFFIFCIFLAFVWWVLLRSLRVEIGPDCNLPCKESNRGCARQVDAGERLPFVDFRVWFSALRSSYTVPVRTL